MNTPTHTTHDAPSTATAHAAQEGRYRPGQGVRSGSSAHHIDAPAPVSGAVRRSAHREVTVFLAVTFTLGWALGLFAASQGGSVRDLEGSSPAAVTAMLLMAFTPMVGALVAARAVGRSLRRPGWGARRPSLRSLTLGWLVGAGTMTAAGVAVWVTGAGGLDAEAIASGMGLGSFPTPVALPSALLVGLTLGALPYVVLAVGEDVGWRGLLVDRLAVLTSPRGVAVGSGLIWAASHLPLFVLLEGTPEGGTMLFAIAAFTVAVAASGSVLAWMQLRWGLWPGVVSHASWNAAVYLLVEAGTTDTGRSEWFVGETGLFAAVVSVVVAVAWWSRAPLVRTPEGRVAAVLRTELRPSSGGCAEHVGIAP